LALAGRFIEIGAPVAHVGAAWGARAQVLLMQGRVDGAREAAETALSFLQRTLSHRPPVYRTLVCALLRMGRAEEARRAAEEALVLRRKLGELGAGDVPLRLAAAEARWATGDVELAASDLGEILALLARRADNIPDPSVRARYLENVPENARARELAAAWR